MLFCRESITQLLWGVTLYNESRVALTVCAPSHFGARVHSPCHDGGPWKQNPENMIPDSSQRIH